MKKISILLVLVLIGLVVRASLRGKQLPHADFTTVMIDSLKTLDPAGMHWVDEGLVALAIWEGLATYHPETLEPISGVAKLPAQISDDGLTFHFELRADARWSNGDPVTAGDFVYGWRRAIEPGTAGVYMSLITDHIAGAKDYSQWRNEAVGRLLELKEGPEDAFQEFRQKHLREIEAAFETVGIRALDDGHLQVRLTRPISYFPDLLAFSTFTPIHEASLELLRDQDEELTLWTYDSQWVKPDYHRNGYPGLVSNGAFRLSDWQFKRYMAFEQNPFYWDLKNVKSQRFTIRIINDPSASFLAYEQGHIDLYRSVTRLDFAPALVEQGQSGLRDDIHVNLAFANYFYRFNCIDRLPDGRANPLKDARVRMALNLAVDKQSLVDNVKKTGNPVALNFIPTGSIPGYSCPPGPEYNLVRAKDLLAQAGYPDGVGLPTIEILYNTGGGHGPIAQAIAEMWRTNLGISSSLKGKEIKSFDEDRKNQNFMVLRSGWYGDYTDPTTFLDLMETHNGNNDGHFSDPEFDRLLAQAAQCTDPVKRMDLLSKAENLLVQEHAPIMPIFYYVNIAAFRPNLKGAIPNPRDRYLFKYIYVEGR
jgi:oligopeptide transport system substrate-binding protein